MTSDYTWLIHPGFGKSATTSLQNNLFGNLDGILNIGRPYSGGTDDRNAVFCREIMRNFDEYDSDCVQALIQSFRQEAAARKIVFSDELLSAAVYQNQAVFDRITGLTPKARVVFRLVVRGLHWTGNHKVLARILARFVEEYQSGELRPLTLPVSAEDRQKMTILFMDPQSFRGEMEAFSTHRDVRLLMMNWGILGRLFRLFVRLPKEPSVDHRGYKILSEGEHFFLAGEDSPVARQRENFRLFYRRLLPVFYELISVNVTVNSNVRFRHDADITWVGDELGYPYICFYREAFHDTPKNVYIVLRRLERLQKFRGARIAVQNQCTLDLFSRANIIDPAHIQIRGAPRMDAFLGEINRRKANDTLHPSTRQVAFFSVPQSTYVMNAGHYEDNVHKKDIEMFHFLPIALRAVRALVEMALDDPDFRLVFKMKDQHIKGPRQGQVGMYKDIIAELNNGQDNLPNVRFELGKMAAHDVIFESDVVVGIQSTTMLEAAIAEKPVVLLHFDDVKALPSFKEVINHQRYEHIFDVPHDENDLKRVVRERLDNRILSDEVVKRRGEVFEEYVSFLDQSATKKSLQICRDAIRDVRKDVNLSTTGI